MDSEEILINYFCDTKSAEREKNLLLDMLRKDKALREEFCNLQNVMALASASKQEGDEQAGHEALAAFKRKVRRRHAASVARTALKYAAVIALVAGTWFFSKRTTENSLRQDNYTWIEAPMGQRVSITLSDGTQVALNPSSRLKIPNVFGDHYRTVELQGEGYFSVAKEEKRPFVVETEQYNLQVLGTEFNVYAYPGSGIFEADLIRGKLYVYDRDSIDSGITLAPAEKAVKEDGVLVKTVSDFAQKDVMYKGIYDFSGIAFGDLIQRMELWYGVRINVSDPAILEQVYIGKFRQSDNITDILNAIKSVGKFDYKWVSDKELTIIPIF